MTVEKRNAFRIGELIRLAVEEISDDEWETRLSLLAGSTSTTESIRSAVEDLSVNIGRKLIAVNRISSTVAATLELMNNKLDLVVEHLAAQQSQRADLGPGTTRACELSATGISFPTSRTLSIGQKLHLRLSIVTDTFYFETLGQVTRHSTDPETGDRVVAVQFYGLRDLDKDKLIKHLLNRQSESIRAKRLNVEAYEDSMREG